MPENNTISIIESAIADAGLTDAGDAGAEAVETTDAVVEPVTETTTDETVVADTKVADTKVVEDKKTEPAKQDDIDKLLEAEGYKGGRDNRIPYSRTKKIIENTLKKRESAHTEALGERDTKIRGYEQVLDTHKRADQLFATDPDRAIQMLATLHPGKYDKFLKGGQAEKPTERAAGKPTDDAPKPQPDVKFDDGTVGYSPEQHDKLLEWNTAKAVAKAIAATKAEYDKRFGPIEQTFNDGRAHSQQLQNVRAIIADARDTYGTEFYNAHEKDILVKIQENDKAVAEGRAQRQPLRKIIDSVLVPKLRAEKNKVREEVMEEASQRAKASEKVETKATKSVRDPNETRDTEDIIREAVAAAGLK